MKRVLIVLVVLAGIGGGVYGARAALERRPAEKPGGASGERHFATATKRDLVDRVSLDGTLGYADARPLSGTRPGTITSIAAEGSTVARGGVLYAVDGTTVRLLFGSTPAWRTLAAGVSNGADVRQLEENLAAMGHRPGTVDTTFTSETTAAIKRWQAATGAAKTGVLQLGEVVFLPGARRMGAHDVKPGDQAGGRIATTTATQRVVTVELAARRQRIVKRGDRVRVELPTGRTVDATVSDVGRVAKAEESGSPGGGGDPTITVTITLEPSARVDGLDEAPVEVGVATSVVRGVTAVPVSALLARAEGGYAVELSDGSLRPVETGAYADGWVEVKGIEAGTKVVTVE